VPPLADYSWEVDNRVMEGLIVFLTERAKGAGVSTLPAGVGSQMASPRPDLLDAATSKPRKPSEGQQSERHFIVMAWEPGGPYRVNQ